MAHSLKEYNDLVKTIRRYILTNGSFSSGEYVLQGELPRELVGTEESRFDLLEEALQLVELGDEPEPKDEPAEVRSTDSVCFN